MRSRFAFLLLGLYLFTATECHELLRLPLLLIHYIQHCQEDERTTFAGFIKMHYSEKMVYDDDWQQDMQLPFKSGECAVFSIPVSLKAEPIVIPLPEQVLICIRFTPNPGLISGKIKIKKIFQPPRFIT